MHITAWEIIWLKPKWHSSGVINSAGLKVKPLDLNNSNWALDLNITSYVQFKQAN